MRFLHSNAPPVFPAPGLGRRRAFSLFVAGMGLVLLSLSAGNLFAFENTGSLTQARGGYTATLLPSGKVLVAGGHRKTIAYSNLASAEVYDPASGMWSPTGSLITARFNHRAVLLPNGKVLVAGGEANGPQVFGILTSAELFDPATGTWTATGNLGTARSNHTMTLLANGTVLVAGGFGVSGRLTSSEVYDPLSGTWTATGSLATKRDSHSATLLANGKVLVVGGVSDNGPPAFNLASAELYDPVSGTWTSTNNLAVARVSHSATLLPNGKVLVAGGFNNPDGVLASAELYDPANGTWASTGSLAVKRSGHAATLLPNGRVFVVGGADDDITAELYDPGTGIWSGAGSLNAVRSALSLTLLLNGKVLITVGSGGNSELYDPSAPAPTPTPTATPTSTPARSLNIATRAQVQTGNNVMIGGFIVTGNVPKRVIVRAIGPSLANAGLAGVLADPILELRGPNGSLIRANDNWRENSDQALLIQASGIPPQDDLESAIVAILPPAGYTAVVSGKSGGTGLGLVEIYDLEENTDSRLANLSTRAVVGTGNSVMIGGFILGGTSGHPRIFVRALGPSLSRFGIANALSDPTLELRDENGGLVAFNNNWGDNPAQAAQIMAAGMQPQDDLEAVIAITPPPGTYTAIATGKAQGTGVGLVEVYNLQ